MDADALVRLVLAGGGPWAQSRDRTITAVAVALAESSGKPRARGGPNVNGTYDHGLWQVNDVHKGTLWPDGADIYDPQTNLRIAQRVWDAQGWGAWATYPLPAAGFMPTAAAAYKRNRGVGGGIGDVTGLEGGIPAGKDEDGRQLYTTQDGSTTYYIDESGNPVIVDQDVDVTKDVNPVKDAAAQIWGMLRWVGDPDNWLRVGYVVLGGAAVIAGLVIVASNSRTVRNAASTAASVRGAK